MTREEEIKKQADKKALEPSRLMHPYAKQYKVMSAYEIGFIEGAVWADEHPHWISVDDELPKEHEWILGFSLKRSYIDVYNFDSNGLFEAHDITHWMPLPQTPKEGGEE